MKRIFYLLKQSLFVKLTLVATLVVGGGSTAWGEDVISGNTINVTDWNTQWGNYTSSWNTNNSSYVQANTWAYYVLVSKNTYNMFSKKIVFSARGIGNSAEITIKKSTTGNSSNDVFEEICSYKQEELGTSLNDNFRSFEVGNINGTCYLLIFAKGVQIESLSIEEQTTPILSVSPSEASFGTVNVSTERNYTVSNIGAGSMDVNISNTNTADFTILNMFDEEITSLIGITNGNPQTFKIRFNYNSNNLGEKSSVISVTPTYDNNSSVIINATATAMSDNAPQLSVIHPVAGDAFGNATAISTKLYTITNTGTGNLTVNIASDNSEYFSVSPTEIKNIGSGASETFTVTFNWVADVSKFGEKSANITVTPTYDENETIVISSTATATAELILDENNPSTITSGKKSSVLIKYTPNSGWNTICMPVVPNNYMSSIFGSGWKAYQLSNYENGVLIFSSTTYVGAGSAYLVYIENASGSNNGLVLTNIAPSYTTPKEATAVGGMVYFQGTYVRKDFVENDNWYGVTSSGQVLQAGEGAYVKGYRAYFTGIEPPANGARVSIVLEGDGTTTDLGFVKMVDKDAKDVYTLSGQKVQKAGKGLYIVNGRKVVIK